MRHYARLYYPQPHDVLPRDVREDGSDIAGGLGGFFLGRRRMRIVCVLRLLLVRCGGLAVPAQLLELRRRWLGADELDRVPAIAPSPSLLPPVVLK